MRQSITAICEYLLFLHVEVLDDNAYEEIEREEGAEYNEEDKVEIHKHSDLSNRLDANLQIIFIMVMHPLPCLVTRAVLIG